VNSPTSFRRLGKNTLVYGFASIASRVVSVVMLPFYTRYLSPAEYGLLQLLDITVEITAILFSAGIRSGLQRFYFKATTDEERNAVVSTTCFLEFGLSLAGTLALLASANFIHRVVLVGAGTSDLVRIAAVNFTLGTLTFVPLSLLVIEQRATLQSIATLAKLAIQVALNVYFLAYRHLGVESILLSTTIASGLLGIVLVVWMLGRTGIRMSRAVVRDLRRFGVPYQITTAASFILVFGDRFFLAHYDGPAEVGLYGLAYQFGFLVYMLGGGSFLTAWAPQRYEFVSHSREERDASYARGFLYFNIIVLTGAMGIVVFVRPAIAVLTTSDYHAAAFLVPIIVAAYVVQSWGDAVKFGIDVAERTTLYTAASWIATGVVLVCYAVLIPRYAGFGAAWATLIAFVVRFAFSYYWSQKVWPVTYLWRRSILLAVIAVAVCLPAVFAPLTHVWSEFALGVVLTLIYAALTWQFVLDETHRLGILEVIRARKLTAIFGRS
jgi:O-antigen/teichoic acid export membrane protein